MTRDLVNAGIDIETLTLCRGASDSLQNNTPPYTYVHTYAHYTHIESMYYIYIIIKLC